MREKNKKSVRIVQEGTTKIEIDKDHATGVLKEPTRGKKVQRASMIVSPCAVMVHIHQLVWYPVWSVQEIVTPVNHQQEASKIARLVQPTHSLSNQQLQAKIGVDRNVVLEPTPLQVSLHALCVRKISTNL